MSGGRLTKKERKCIKAQRKFEKSFSALVQEQVPDPLRDDWYRAGIDEHTAVDKAIARNGEKVYVTCPRSFG